MGDSFQCLPLSLSGILRFPTMDLQFQIEAYSAEPSGQHGLQCQMVEGHSVVAPWRATRNAAGRKLNAFQSPEHLPLNHGRSDSIDPWRRLARVGLILVDLHPVLLAHDSYSDQTPCMIECWLALTKQLYTWLNTEFNCHDFNIDFIHLIVLRYLTMIFASCTFTPPDWTLNYQPLGLCSARSRSLTVQWSKPLHASQLAHQLETQSSESGMKSTSSSLTEE